MIVYGLAFDMAGIVWALTEMAVTFFVIPGLVVQRLRPLILQASRNLFHWQSIIQD